MYLQEEVVFAFFYPMEFHVESAGITDWLSLCISSPQSGGGGVTVSAGQAHPPRGRLQQIKHVSHQQIKTSNKTFLLLLLFSLHKESIISLKMVTWWRRWNLMSSKFTHQASLGFDERSVDAVHLVIKSTSVAQVVTSTIPPPEGGWHCPTVHALSPLSEVIK